MSDTQPTNGGDAANAQAQQPSLSINGQYIKDLSFESPNSPGIFRELNQKQPDIKVDVNVRHAKVENEQGANLFEVVLELNAEMKVGDKVGFLVELKYGGIFTVNVPEEHLQAVLLVECPRLLFPFARQMISDVTQQGGYMPLLLQPIDFAGMYQQSMRDQAAQAEADVEKTLQERGIDPNTGEPSKDD